MMVTATSSNMWGYIVSIAGFAAFAGCAAPINSYGRIFTAIQHDLNITSVEAGWIGSVSWSSNFLASPLAVVLVQLTGYRTVAVFAAVMMSGAYFMTSLMESYIGILLLYGLLAGVMCCFVVHITFSSILKAFDPSHHNRGASIVACGSSLGTIIVSMAYEKLTVSIGWRRTLQITSLYIAILSIPAAFFLTPHDKRKYSNVAASAGETKEEVALADGYMPEVTDEPENKRWLRLLLMWRSWLLFFGLFFPAMAWSVYWINIISFYESISVPADDIFLYVSIQTFSDLAGRIFLCVFGTYLTHVPAIVIGCNLIFVPVTAVMAMVTVKPVLILSSFAIGVGRGWFTILSLTASVDLLQVANSDQAVSLSLLALGFAFLIGTVPAGLIYDMTGSYSYAFVLNSAFYLVGAVLFAILLVLKKARRRRKLSQRLSLTGT